MSLLILLCQSGGIKLDDYKVSCGEWLQGKIKARSELDAIQKLCISEGLDPYIAPINNFQVEKIAKKNNKEE